MKGGWKQRTISLSDYEEFEQVAALSGFQVGLTGQTGAEVNVALSMEGKS
jgi:hypothetical protein